MKSKYQNHANRTQSHFRPNHVYKSRRKQTHQIFKQQTNVTNEKEGNLSKFWRECRERDIRKRQRMCKQFASKHNHFNSTISQLKLDAKILSNRFQRVNTIKNSNKENRRHSMYFNNCSNIPIKENRNKENRTHSSRRMSNMYIPSTQTATNDLKDQNTEQSENAKIFFENKQYYSSLYHKHNKTHIYDVNDENNLRHKLKQKWKDLKKDVNKLNYFNKQKTLNPKRRIEKTDSNKTVQQSAKKDVLNNTFMYLPNKQKSMRQKTKKYKHTTYGYKPRESNIITNDTINNEHKDQESHLNESNQPIQSEIVKGTYTQLATPKHEEKAPSENVEKLENVENVEKVENAENIENVEENTINEDTNQSSIYCISHLQKSNEYWGYSVRQLKNKLINMNVSIDKCIEKKDLIEKIKAHNTNQNKSTNISNKYYRKKSSKPAVFSRQSKKTQRSEFRSGLNNTNRPSILYDTILNDTRESRQQIMYRVDLWIHRWSYRRSFRQLLNSVLGYKPNDNNYICRGKQGDQNYLLMIKSYKKAMFLLHPDKHINSSFEIKYKSAEMFKILINLCDKYKERYEKKKTY